MRRTVVFVVVLLLLTLLQVVLFGIVPFGAPQLVLCYIVAASSFYNYHVLIWSALAAGILLDITGPHSSFGVHMGILILAVLVSKLIIRIEDQAQRLLFSVLVVSVFTLLTYLTSVAILLQKGESLRLVMIILPSVVTILYNGVITALFYGGFEVRNSRTSHRKSSRFHLVGGK